MNRLLAFGLSLLVTLLASRTSLAAPTITIGVKDASMARVAFAGFTAGDFCAVTKEEVSACLADAKKCTDNPPISFTLPSPERTPYQGVALTTLPSIETYAVQSLLARSALWCTSAGTAVTVPITIAPEWPMATLVGASSLAPAANKLEWLGWDAPAFLPIVSKITGKLQCDFVPTTTTKCSVVRERGPSGGARLLFVADGELPKLTAVKVKAGDPAKIDELVTVPVQECAYSLTGAITSLYAGSKEQRIQLESSTGCLTRVGRFTTVTLTQGQVEVVATPQVSTTGIFLQTGTVPSKVAIGWGDWDIRANNARVGSVRINVKGPAAVARSDGNGKPRLSVRYDRDEFNALHSGEAVEGQAVVTNPAVHTYVAVINRSSLIVDDELLRRGDAIATELEQDGAECERLRLKAACAWKDKSGTALDSKKPKVFCVDAKFDCTALADSEQETLTECAPYFYEEKVVICRDELRDSGSLFDDLEEAELEVHRDVMRPWRVEAKTWDDAWFKEDWFYQGGLRTFDPSSMGFAVYSRHADPLEVELLLRGVGGETLLRTEVVLAAGARTESLPLPIAKALRVECGTKDDASELPKDLATDGQVRAVDDGDLDTGQCKLTYHPKRMGKILQLDDAEVLKQQLLLYGSQPIEITIARGKEPPVIVPWDLEPANADELVLPVVKEGAGDYVVTAKLKGTSAGDKVYRPASPSQVAAIVAGTAPTNRQFKATLLPRGFGGWAGSEVRVFVTFPIRFTGVRLPAKAAELKSSNDISTAQLTGVRAGTMVVIEPWDYNTRKNRYAIPIRFMSGMNLFDVGNASFAPAVLNGFSIALPILPMEGSASASTTETTVSVGAFWELDLETSKPFSDGHHFLLTIGLDVLSLFAH